MSTSSERIAQVLVDMSAVNFTPDAPITFKSGIKSPVYVDNRTIPYIPAAWHTVIEGFSETIKDQNLAYDVIAGIATAGIPHSAALAYTLQKPSVFIRKEAKAHGQKKRIEGGEVSGKRVLLIEDLITTGGSSLSGVDELRNDGATVSDCMAIVSYGFSESADAFQAADIRLHTLTTFEHILAYARSQGKITETMLKSVETWMQDPHTWAG